MQKEPLRHRAISQSIMTLLRYARLCRKELFFPSYSYDQKWILKTTKKARQQVNLQMENNKGWKSRKRRKIIVLSLKKANQMLEDGVNCPGVGEYSRIQLKEILKTGIIKGNV